MSEQTPVLDLEAISRLQRERSYAQALDLAERMKSIYPRNHLLRKKLSHIHDAMRRLDLAIDEISEAIRIAPWEPDYYVNRALWYLESGELERSVSDCTAAIDIERKIGWRYYLDSSYFIRALAKWRCGDYASALDDCNEVADDMVFWALGQLQSKKALVEQLKQHVGLP